jgi:hypothetical protein
MSNNEGLKVIASLRSQENRHYLMFRCALHALLPAQGLQAPTVREGIYYPGAYA